MQQDYQPSEISIQGTSRPLETVSSPWLDYTPPVPQSVFERDETIVLSPSSVATYLTCPRKFFYQYLLSLKDPTVVPEAALGSFIHRVLEVFNKQFQQDYTLENLKTLTNMAFQYEDQWEQLLSRGFSKSDFKNLKALSPLQRQQIQKQMLSAFESLEANGYFQVPFETLHIEEKLTLQSIPGIDGLQLKGRSDLIRQRPDGSLEIVDYKTSRRKYSAVKEETNLRPLLNALDLVDWEETDIHKRYGLREYQLPLYWLMAKASPNFQGKKVDVSIQLVRPAGLSKPGSGCHTLTLTDAQLEEGKQNILDLLRTGLADPLRQSQDFLPMGSRKKHCSNCSYRYMCEGPKADDDEGSEDA